MCYLLKLKATDRVCYFKNVLLLSGYRDFHIYSLSFSTMHNFHQCICCLLLRGLRQCLRLCMVVVWLTIEVSCTLANQTRSSVAPKKLSDNLAIHLLSKSCQQQQQKLRQGKCEMIPVHLLLFQKISLLFFFLPMLRN